MARMPNGVAAFARPSTFAEKVKIIAPIAGWFGGTSGNSRTVNGRSALAMTRQHTASFSHFHQAEEQRHHAHQTDRERHGSAGGFHDSRIERAHGRHSISGRRHPADLLVGGREERDKDEGEENSVHAR